MNLNGINFAYPKIRRRYILPIAGHRYIRPNQIGHHHIQIAAGRLRLDSMW